MLTRRHALLSASTLIPAAMLAACGAVTQNTANGVTTYTVNVAEITAWGQAFANAAALIAGLPGLIGTPVGLSILGIETVAKADLTAFAAVAGSNVTLTFDSTSVPNAIESLLADGRTLLTDAGGALGDVASNVVATAQTYIGAVQTIVSLLSASIGAMTAAAAVPGVTPMTEAKALAVLGVTK